MSRIPGDARVCPCLFTTWAGELSNKVNPVLILPPTSHVVVDLRKVGRFLRKLLERGGEENATSGPKKGGEKLGGNPKRTTEKRPVFEMSDGEAAKKGVD